MPKNGMAKSCILCLCLVSCVMYYNTVSFIAPLLYSSQQRNFHAVQFTLQKFRNGSSIGIITDCVNRWRTQYQPMNRFNFNCCQWEKPHFIIVFHFVRTQVTCQLGFCRSVKVFPGIVISNASDTHTRKTNKQCYTTRCRH